MSVSEEQSLGIAGLAIGFILATGLFYLFHNCKFEHDDLLKYHTYEVVTGPHGSYRYNKNTGEIYYLIYDEVTLLETKKEQNWRDTVQPIEEHELSELETPTTNGLDQVPD